jgi:hypothetical protein
LTTRCQVSNMTRKMQSGFLLFLRIPMGSRIWRLLLMFCMLSRPGHGVDARNTQRITYLYTGSLRRARGLYTTGLQYKTCILY